MIYEIADSKIIKEFYTSYGEKSLYNYTSHPRQNYTYYGILEGDIIIAITGVVKISEKSAMLAGTLVAPNYRGIGISKKLMADLEKELASVGIIKLISEIYTDNYKQIMNRIKSGFLVEGLIKDYEEVGIHCYILGKSIGQEVSEQD